MASSIFKFGSTLVEVKREPGKKDDRPSPHNSLFTVENKNFIFKGSGPSFLNGKAVDIGRSAAPKAEQGPLPSNGQVSEKPSFLGQDATFDFNFNSPICKTDKSIASITSLPGNSSDPSSSSSTLLSTANAKKQERPAELAHGAASLLPPSPLSLPDRTKPLAGVTKSGTQLPASRFRSEEPFQKQPESSSEGERRNNQDLPRLRASRPGIGQEQQTSSAGGNDRKGTKARMVSPTVGRSYQESDRSNESDRDRHRTATKPHTTLRPIGTSAPTVREQEEAAMLRGHLGLLDRPAELDQKNEAVHTPIFTKPVLDYVTSISMNNGGAGNDSIRQWGLLGGDTTFSEGKDAQQATPDPRIFWNVSAPSSVFICGSQGSGKSHTLSCLLENCLLKSAASQLNQPLTAIVFNYDTWSSDTGGSPCEAAWLAGQKGIGIRVLCPPTNVATMKKLYSRFPKIQVQELRLGQNHLNTKRMMDLMGVTSTGDAIPLYINVVARVLRDMRLAQQQNGGGFNYAAFKKNLEAAGLRPDQLVGLRQRLDILESFLSLDHVRGHARQNGQQPTDWTPRAGQLTIVDLSCPCVTAEAACSMFNICLSLFLEQSSNVGRVIALDEAHKYMTEAVESQTLTDSLLRTIREQRHIGARVLISTQEPTISPKLMDLCNVTIVHRFTSPDWLNALKQHLAGVSSAAHMLLHAEALASKDSLSKAEEYRGVTSMTLHSNDLALEVFSKIVHLRVGEALLFSPSAVIGVRRSKEGKTSVKKLAHGVLKVRIRNRVTNDGGRSIMA